VKIFYGRTDIEEEVNEFLSNLPNGNIEKIETIAFPTYDEEVDDYMAILVWLKTTRKEDKAT